MVVLVTGQVQFPSKNAFIKELLKACPVCDDDSSEY